MTEETKEKKLTGFALNKGNINRGGRPKGAKGTKSRALKRAEQGIMEMQEGALDAARFQYAIMKRDPTALAKYNMSSDDVSPQMQMKASENFLKMSRETPELLKLMAKTEDSLDEESEEDSLAPVISLQPKQA